MKKFLFVIFSIFLFCGNAVAFEWGGLFTNESKLGLVPKFNSDNQTESSFAQNNGLSLWLSTPISKDNNWNFKAEISYDFEFNPENELKVKNIIDCGLMKISGLIPIKSTLIDLAFGRFLINCKFFTY